MMLAQLGADASATRTVYLIVGGLVLIGVLLGVLAWWLVRQTRVEPELLAPLERMSERSWLKRSPTDRRRLLDEVRPNGAEPLHAAPAAPAVDEEFARPAPAPRSMDDLVEAPVSLAPPVAATSPPPLPPTPPAPPTAPPPAPGKSAVPVEASAESVGDDATDVERAG